MRAVCPTARERSGEPAPRRPLSPYLPINPAGARAARTGPAATTAGPRDNAAPTRPLPWGPVARGRYDRAMSAAGRAEDLNPIGLGELSERADEGPVVMLN